MFPSGDGMKKEERKKHAIEVVFFKKQQQQKNNTLSQVVLTHKTGSASNDKMLNISRF